MTDCIFKMYKSLLWCTFLLSISIKSTFHMSLLLSLSYCVRVCVCGDYTPRKKGYCYCTNTHHILHWKKQNWDCITVTVCTTLERYCTTARHYQFFNTVPTSVEMGRNCNEPHERRERKIWSQYATNKCKNRNKLRLVQLFPEGHSEEQAWDIDWQTDEDIQIDGSTDRKNKPHIHIW